MIKERIKAIIKQYADKGARLLEEAYENGEHASTTGYWDGYGDCANLLLRELDDMQEEPESHKPKITLGEATGKLKIDDFTRALAECINQAQCAVIDPMAHAEIWKNELLELANGKEPVSEDIQKVGSLKSLEYYPEKKTTNKTSKVVFDANMPRRKAYLRGFKDGAHAHKELIANKPASEDLEEAALLHLSKHYDKSVIWDEDEKCVVRDFKAGANWQLNQIRKENEKNRD